MLLPIKNIIILSLFLLFTTSFAQPSHPDEYSPDSKIFVKNPDEVLRSLYLDNNGAPSEDMFKRVWGIYPKELSTNIKSYFKISFNKTDIIINNDILVPNKNLVVSNLDYFIETTKTYKSANIAEPIWDGRVYQSDNKLYVGGYSSSMNERPVGEIDNKGRFNPNTENNGPNIFPILTIPANEIVYNPFNGRLIRVKSANDEKVEEKIQTYLPLTIYGEKGEDFKNLRFSLEMNEDKSSVLLYAINDSRKFEIAHCNLFGSKIIKSTDGFRPELNEGCTQSGESEIISLIFEGEFSETIEQSEGDLYLNNNKIEESAILVDKSESSDGKAIMVDGYFNDWRNIKGVGDFKEDYVSYLYPNPDTDLLEFKITNDDKYLYFYTRVAGAHGRTGEKGRYYWYTYIDVDSNPKTGYPPTRDDNCYFGIPIGDDSEAQFEFIGNRFVKTFFGFTGIGAEKEVLSGELELGPSFYSATDSQGKKREKYKTEYVNREGERFITHDYTEGTSEDIVIALSSDGSEVEMKVELAGFLKDIHGKMLMPIGNKIDIAAGVEGSSGYYGSDEWGADSSPVIYGYELK